MIFVFTVYWFPAVWTRQFLIPSAIVFTFLLAYSFAIKVPTHRMIAIVSSGILAVFCWKVTQVAPFHNYIQTTYDMGGDQVVQWRKNGPHQLYALLKPFLKNDFRHLIWFSSYGWVDANTVGWEAAKDGHPCKMYNCAELKKVNSPVPETAEIVIFSDSGILGELQTPHDISIQKLKDFKNADLCFSFVGSIKDPGGRMITVYSRLSNLHQ